MKYYKCINGKKYSSNFETGKIYKSNDDSWSVFDNTVQNLIYDSPEDFKEVSKSEYLQQQLNHLQKELDDQYKEINELKKETESETNIKVGKWYVSEPKNSRSAIAKVTSYKGSWPTGIGINYGDRWSTNIGIRIDRDDHNVREATKDEIKEALDKERKRRGLVQNSFRTNVKRCLYNPSKMNDLSIDSETGIVYDKENDAFWVHRDVVYYNGNWAEPTQQNKIYDYTVEKNGNNYAIGCEKNIKPSHLSWLKRLCLDHNIKIELEGMDVTEDIINLEL